MSLRKPSSARQCSAGRLRVRFGNLPRIDRRTGSVIDSIPQKSIPQNAQSVGTTVSQTPNQTNKQTPSQLTSQHQEREQEQPPKSWTSLFKTIKWTEDPHPGRRVPIDPHEHEPISPLSTVVRIPAWSLEAEAEWFRRKVQPRRVTGRRRPGMSARQPAPRSKGGFDDEEEERCVVQ